MINLTSFSQAAVIVADEFLQTMQDGGFNTFREMQECYWWEASDIREEISYILESKTDAYVFDDGSYVQFGIDDMPYGEFKKLVFQKLKNVNKY